MSVVTSFSHQNQFDFNVWPKTIKTLAKAVQYPQMDASSFTTSLFWKQKKKEQSIKYQEKTGLRNELSLQHDWSF